MIHTSNVTLSIGEAIRSAARIVLNETRRHDSFLAKSHGRALNYKTIYPYRLIGLTLNRTND